MYKMKFIKQKTLNEAIAEVMDKDRGFVGPVYADAVRQHQKVKDIIEKEEKERKLEMPNEDRFAHEKVKGTSEQKKMKLSESLFTEWVEDVVEDEKEEDLEEELTPEQKYPVKSPIAEDIETKEDKKADGSNPIQFAEQPEILKDIMVAHDGKVGLVYVAPDGTQTDLDIEPEDIELDKESIFTNQRTINKEKLENFIKSVDELPPITLIYDDKKDIFHILDGNHRAVAFIESDMPVKGVVYDLSAIEDKLKDVVKPAATTSVKVNDGLKEQKWLVIKDLELNAADGSKIKLAVTAPASVIMAVEKDDVNNGIDSGLYGKDGLVLDDYFLMMETEDGKATNEYAEYLKIMGKVDEALQQCQKYPIDVKKTRALNELTEDLDSDIAEELKSKVYKELSNIAFRYHYKGIDLTDKDFELAMEWFITHFGDEAEWSFNTSLEEELQDCQKYPIEKPEAKDSQFISKEDKQPMLHIDAKDSQFVSAGDKAPHLVEEVEPEKLEESSYTKAEGSEYFAKPNRGPIADVIEQTLEGGEWGYVKSPDGTISPVKLPHLSYEADEIAINWDREDRCFFKVPVKPLISKEDIIEVADRFHKEYKVVNEYGKEYVLIYMDEDADWEGNYVGDDFPVNREGVKGRGTGKRGNPNAPKKKEIEVDDDYDGWEDFDKENELEEELTPEQKYPVQSPIAESLTESVNFKNYSTDNKEAQATLDIIKNSNKIELFDEMAKDKFVKGVSEKELDDSLIKERDWWFNVLNIKDADVEE